MEPQPPYSPTDPVAVPPGPPAYAAPVYGGPAYGAPEPASPEVVSSGGSRAGTWAIRIGAVVAGVLLGAAGMLILRGGDDGTAPAAATGPGAFPQGQPPAGPGQNGPGGQGGGFGGGLDGEQRLVGTLTAVGADSVTVRGTDGSAATYTVVGGTEIVRDGSRATLADLQVGDRVLVHVYPSGNQMLVERLFAGQQPQFGPGDGQGGPAADPTASSTAAGAHA